MPIRAEMRPFYAKDWKAISLRIREAAGQACQGSPLYPDCRAANGKPHPVTGSKVVLTVAHLDHDPTNNADANLRAWCQRCHLAYDAAHHAETRRRSVEEWVGKTPDTKVPPRVRLRVFQNCGGICHRSGRKIQPGEAWQTDHIVALIDGGENRERNLAPILVTKHKEKTAEEVARKAKVDRLAKKHLGIKGKKAVIAGSKASGWKRKIDGSVVRRGEG